MTEYHDARSVEPKPDPKKTSTLEAVTLVDLDEEIVRLRKDLSTSEEAGYGTKMLVKHPEFRIVLITMNSEADGQSTKPIHALPYSRYKVISGFSLRAAISICAKVNS
jgi:hypothetical protein